MNTTDLKLNLGCGLQCPIGWVNIDSSLGVKISKHPFLKKILYAILPKSILPNINWSSNTIWMELTKPFPMKTETVDCIYSSHTFEHFTYNETKFVLSECYRIMKKGAVIRIIVPDFEVMINNYLKNKESNPENAALLFSKHSGYFEIPVPNTLKGVFKFFFQRKNNHYFLYDEAGLKKQFKDAGFIELQRKQYGDSRIDGISLIDIDGRFNGAICLEAIKK